MPGADTCSIRRLHRTSPSRSCRNDRLRKYQARKAQMTKVDGEAAVEAAGVSQISCPATTFDLPSSAPAFGWKPPASCRLRLAGR